MAHCCPAHGVLCAQVLLSPCVVWVCVCVCMCACACECLCAPFGLHVTLPLLSGTRVVGFVPSTNERVSYSLSRWHDSNVKRSRRRLG